MQAARLVFQRALVAFVRRRGGSATTEDIVGGLGWFWLRLDRHEVEEVLEISQGRIVTLTGRTQKQTGEVIDGDEWILNDEGKKLNRMRGLRPKDLGLGLAALVSPAADAGEKWGKRGAAAATVAGLGALSRWVGVQPWIIWTVLGVTAAITLRSALRGERALRDAARRWPRLAVCRPRLHEWQTTSWRRWPPPVDVLVWIWVLGLATTLGLFGDWRVGKTRPPIDRWSHGTVTVGVAVAAFVFYVLLRGRNSARYARLRLAVHREVKLVKRLRKMREATASRRRCAFGDQCPGNHAPGLPLYERVIEPF